MNVTQELSGRHVRLRAIQTADYDVLYSLISEPEVAVRWRFRGATPSPDQFVQSLWTGVLVQFVIEIISTNEVVGLVSAFNADHANSFAHFAVVVHPDVARHGWTLEGVALFLSYLFSTWNFRKLYAETAEFNFVQFASGEGKLFNVEGRLTDHEYYGGRYWDFLILAFRREIVVEALGYLTAP